MRSERRAYPRDRLWMQLSEGAKLGQTSPGCFSRRPLLGASDLREPLLDARVELLEPCLELLSRGIGEALQYLLEAREARVIDMLRELESLVRELDALGAAIIRITLERDVSCSFHLLAQARHVGFVDPQKIDKVRERGALARELEVEQHHQCLRVRCGHRLAIHVLVALELFELPHQALKAFAKVFDFFDVVCVFLHASLSCLLRAFMFSALFPHKLPVREPRAAVRRGEAAESTHLSDM